MAFSVSASSSECDDGDDGPSASLPPRSSLRRTTAYASVVARRRLASGPSSPSSCSSVDAAWRPSSPASCSSFGVACGASSPSSCSSFGVAWRSSSPSSCLSFDACGDVSVEGSKPMIHRECGVLKTTYEADMALYPLPIAKYAVAVFAVVFFLILPLMLHEYYLSIANLVWIAVIGALCLTIVRGY